MIIREKLGRIKLLRTKAPPMHVGSLIQILTLETYRIENQLSKMLDYVLVNTCRL